MSILMLIVLLCWEYTMSIVCLNDKVTITAPKAHICSREYLNNFLSTNPDLQLISTFQRLLNSQRKKISDAKQRYEAGLEKITSTQSAVDPMTKELESKSLAESSVVLARLRARLKRAKQLTSDLEGERGRWRKLSDELSVKYRHVTGDMLLSAGVITYLGSFVMSYRDEAIKRWLTTLQNSDIACSDPFKLRDTLGDEIMVREWVINKLPNDSLSVDNAIIFEQSIRWPLIIDPEGQANRWVKNTYALLKVTKLSFPNFLDTVKAALQ